MPLRTIKDAVFLYTAADGRRVWAQRAEQHDIPEGEDLERGDRLGAFTPNGEEPPAVPGSFIPSIDLTWEPDEWERWVDAGKINEIIGHINQLPDAAERARAATAVIQAEHGRGDKARQELLQSVAQLADYVPVRSDPDTSSNSDLSLLSDEDLAAYVRVNSADVLLAAVGDNIELATEVRAAEIAGKARKGLLASLNELIGDHSVTPDEIQRAKATGSIGVPSVEEATAGAPDDETSGEPGDNEDLADFVVSSTKDAVLERVGDNAELAEQARAIEEGRGDKARSTLLEVLDKIITPAAE